MKKVSVIIPAREEIYLQETIDNLLDNSRGDIEIIAVLDGYWPEPPIKQDKRVVVVHRARLGMRDAINSGVSIANGEYVMKVDAHCAFSKAFDIELQKNCDDDWIVIPRRYSLDSETWTYSRHKNRPFVDYEYLLYPLNKKVMRKRMGIHALVWDERILNRCDRILDENMTFQGSCWFMKRDHFVNRIGYMSEEGYGTFVSEAQELGLKTQLMGGKIMTNKKVWYAHLWKGDPYRKRFKELYNRSYTRVSGTEAKDGSNFTIDYWLNNRWKDAKYPFVWLLERFWPVPTWPTDIIENKAKYWNKDGEFIPLKEKVNEDS